MTTHVASEGISLRRPRDRTLWVGLFVLAGVAAVLITLFTATNPGTFRRRYTVAGITTDAAGLRKGDAVRMRGVNIGRVLGFKILPEGVALDLEIEGKYEIPSDSRFILTTSNIMGDMVVEILPGESPAPLRRGESLQGGSSQPLVGQLGDIAGEASSALERIQALLSQKTVANVEESTAQLSKLLAELTALISEERAEINALTRSLSRSAKGIERATGPELDRSIKRLDTLTARLDELSVSLERTASSAEAILGRIERGEGLLGRMSKDDSLYTNANQAVLNLGKAAADLSRLTEDIQRNPKRYINVEIF